MQEQQITHSVPSGFVAVVVAVVASIYYSSGSDGISQSVGIILEHFEPAVLMRSFQHFWLPLPSAHF